MRLPPCMANHSSKPLFHAISPSINNDGYLVCYLPQNWPPVKAAIGHLPNQSSTTPASPVSKPVPSKGSTPSSYQCIIDGSQLHRGIRPVDMIIFPHTLFLQLTTNSQPTQFQRSLYCLQISTKAPQSSQNPPMACHIEAAVSGYCMGQVVVSQWGLPVMAGVSSWPDPFQQHLYPPPIS